MQGTVPSRVRRRSQRSTTMAPTFTSSFVCKPRRAGSRAPSAACWASPLASLLGRNACVARRRRAARGPQPGARSPAKGRAAGLATDSVASSKRIALPAASDPALRPAQRRRQGLGPRRTASRPKPESNRRTPLCKRSRTTRAFGHECPRLESNQRSTASETGALSAGPCRRHNLRNGNRLGRPGHAAG
jgi:hypothetical protein